MGPPTSEPLWPGENLSKMPEFARAARIWPKYFGGYWGRHLRKFSLALVLTYELLLVLSSSRLYLKSFISKPWNISNSTQKLYSNFFWFIFGMVLLFVWRKKSQSNIILYMSYKKSRKDKCARAKILYNVPCLAQHKCKVSLKVVFQIPWSYRYFEKNMIWKLIILLILSSYLADWK